MASGDEGAREAIRAWIEQEHGQLERRSYYQLLGIARDATDAQVRTGYYNMVARLHPDMYGDLLDEDTRGKLVTLYSRIVEGYRILTAKEKREQYDRMLAQAQGRLRWSAADERAPKDPETEIGNPNARRFYRLARAALMAGDAKAAVMHLRLARSVEPANQLLESELARAEAAVKGET